MADVMVIVSDDSAAARILMAQAREAGLHAVLMADTGVEAGLAARLRPALVAVDVRAQPVRVAGVWRRLQRSCPTAAVAALCTSEGVGEHADWYAALGVTMLALPTPWTVPPAELQRLVGESVRRRGRRSRHGRTGDPGGVASSGEIDLLLIGSRVVDMRTGSIDGASDHVLPPQALALLAVLRKHAGQVVSPEVLAREAWGDAADGRPRGVREQIAALRTLLEPVRYRPVHIVSVRRRGYVLEP